jgi:AcrR family transcriptional regulator
MTQTASLEAKVSTREKVLSAATDLFVANGFEATSIADICRVSGVSNGSVFHHFGGKEGIALEIYLREWRTYWERITAPMEAETDALAGIEASVRASFFLLTERPDFTRFMVDLGNSTWLRRHGEVVASLNGEYMGRVFAWAQPHIEAGRLVAAHPFAWSSLLFGSVNWMALLTQMLEQPTDTEAMLDDLVRLVRKTFTP